MCGKREPKPKPASVSHLLQQPHKPRRFVHPRTNLHLCFSLSLSLSLSVSVSVSSSLRIPFPNTNSQNLILKFPNITFEVRKLAHLRVFVAKSSKPVLKNCPCAAANTEAKKKKKTKKRENAIERKRREEEERQAEACEGIGHRKHQSKALYSFRE